MSDSSQKMKTRAIMVSILNKYRNTPNVSTKLLKKDIEAISSLDNKDYAAKMLFSEITDMKSDITNVCVFFLLNAIDDNSFEKQAIDAIADKNTDDEKKFFIISLLKQKGIPFDYANLHSYIKDPEQLAKNGVKDFLCNALDDPEVQIDLLDFYTNITYEEKIYLIKNLLDEQDDDKVSNALSIISYLDTDKEETALITDGLCSCVSVYALEGLTYLANSNKTTSEQKKRISKKIKEIKFKYPNLPLNPIIQGTKFHKCFISFCDGESNFSVVVSRMHKNRSVDAFLLTINLVCGIVSCMGFGNINEENLFSIISRLFSDSLPVDITPAEIKAFISHYMQNNISTKTPIPYEYTVWKKLLDDVEDVEFPLECHINKNPKVLKLSQGKLKKFCCSKMLETWYFSQGQNDTIDKLLNKIDSEKILEISKLNSLTVKTINDELMNDINYVNLIKQKLIFQSYVAHLAKLQVSSECAYSSSLVLEYIRELTRSIVDRSVYYFFSNKLYELEENKDNKFSKLKTKTKYTKSELENIMNVLEEKWS